MKKWLAVLLGLMLFLTAAMALAEEETMTLAGEFYGVVYEDDQIDLYRPAFTDDREELFIPREIDGLKVNTIWVNDLPQSVHTLFIHEDSWLQGDEDLPKRTFTVYRYADYDKVQEEEYWRDRLPQMQPEELALLRVRVWDSKDQDYDDLPQPVRAETLPGELNGQKLLIALPEDEVIFTHEGFAYQKNWEGNAQIVGCPGLAAGETLLSVPGSLGGLKVNGIDLDAIPAGVEKIHAPEDVNVGGWDETDTPRTFTLYVYADQQILDDNSHLASRVGTLAADEAAIVEVQQLNFDKKGRTETDLTVNAADLPDTIGGFKAVNGLHYDHVVYETGVFRYKHNHEGKANIIACTQTEGDSLLIPFALQGHTVSRVRLDTLPGEIKTLYVPKGVYFDYDSASQASREWLLVRYMDYAQAQEEQYVLERAPQLGEKDLALYEVSRMLLEGGKLNTQSTPILASRLPQTLDGQPCVPALYSDRLQFESGQWIYTLNNEKTRASIADVKDPQPTDLLIIPAAIEGLPVEQWASHMPALFGAEFVLSPEGGYPSWGDETAAFHCFTYVTKETVSNSNNREYYEGKYGTDLGNRMYLIDYYRFEKGEQQYDATIEYSLIPTAVQGYEVFNEIRIYSKVTRHTYEEYKYINLADGTVAITDCDNDVSKNIIVPARINDKPVTAIINSGERTYTFYNNKLTTLKLPSTLKVLGARALYAYDLKSLDLPAGLEEIGEQSIVTSVKSLTLPDGVKRLGSKFASTRAKSLKIPASVTALDANCFSQMNYLTKLTIPETVQHIGTGAFSEMSSLTALTLPENLTALPELMAANNPKLAKITLPAAVATIGDRAFTGCEKLKTVTFAKKGSQLTHIGEGAFSTTALSKVALPEGVETIGKEAFSGCTKLASITLPSTLREIGKYAFTSTALKKAELPQGLAAIPEGLFMDCGKLTAVTIPASVTQIGDYAFEGCSSKLTLTVEADSFAHTWAQENGFKVKVKK